MNWRGMIAGAIVGVIIVQFTEFLSPQYFMAFVVYFWGLIQNAVLGEDYA